jgi:branched-chain amino acid transport system permease protein
MAAADWRKAMNTGALTAMRGQRSGAPWQGAPARPAPAAASRSAQAITHEAYADSPAVLRFFWKHIQPRHTFIMLGLLLYPFLASSFFTFQIAGQALVLGIIALSLSFLGGYGGMMSLAQMTVAGIAGYAVAIFGSSGTAQISLNWPWWLAILLALVIGTLLSTLIGWLSVRTEGIYTIMITLAIGVAFYYLALQNYTIFNGFQGFQSIVVPTLFGIHWRAPTPFYFLTLTCALVAYFLVKYLLRAPFGIALQGVRDNPRRMASLGYNVTAIRVTAYAFSGFLASIGGVLFIWYSGLVTPGMIGLSALVNVLVIAVLGGMKHPIGAFIGAVIFVLLQNFAIDLVDRERFNLVIGGVFLVIVLFSTDGVLGWYKALANKISANHARARMNGQL